MDLTRLYKHSQQMVAGVGHRLWLGWGSRRAMDEDLI